MISFQINKTFSIVWIFIKLFVSVYCISYNDISCINQDNASVALYVTGSDDVTSCYRQPFGDIFTYDANDCKPDKKCITSFKDHCKNNPCGHEGECLNNMETYVCFCKSGFHGRNCSNTGEGLTGMIFLYNPFENEKSQLRYSTTIIIPSSSKYSKITFSAEISGEFMNVDTQQINVYVKKISHKNLKALKTICTDNHYTSKINSICDKLQPPSDYKGLTFFYDGIYNITEPTLMKDNKQAGKKVPAFKVYKLTLSLYSGDSEEFAHSFNQVRSYKKHCQTKVTLKNCNYQSNNPRQIKRDKRIVIQSVLTNITCPYLERNYTWEVFKYDESVFTKKTPNPLETRVGTDQSTYEINQFRLDIGVFKIKLNVEISGRNPLNKDKLYTANYKSLCFVEVLRRPLSPIIKGGLTRRVKVGGSKESLQLDATESYDPNQPPDKQDHLRWMWTSDPPNFCEKPDEKICKVNKELRVGQKVIFTLTLSTGDGSCPSEQKQQLIIGSNTSQAQLEIRCLKNCGINDFKTNPTEVMYLEVNVKDKVEIEEIKWFYSNDGDQTRSEVESEMKQENTEPNLLIILPNKLLKPGSNCTFTAKIKGSIEKEPVAGSSSILIKVNRPPTQGKCDIQPQKGFKFLTEFNINCSGFSVENEIAQLRYGLYQVASSGNLVTFLGEGYTGTFKKVNLTDNMVSIKVSDPFGMFTYSNFSVELEFPSDVTVDSMIQQFNLLLLNGDTVRCVRAIGAMIEIMWNNKSENSALIDSVLDSLIEVPVYDLTAVRLQSSVLGKLTAEGGLLYGTKVGSKTVKTMGSLMASLSGELRRAVARRNMRNSALLSASVTAIVLTMLDCTDVISSSNDKAIFESSIGSLDIFSTHDQFKKGTSGMVRALHSSGSAIIANLLPQEQETVIISVNTTMWLKVDRPDRLKKNAIPTNSSTHVKISEELSNFLGKYSENVAVEMITVKNNPYWWDMQDRNIASETVSIRIWEKPSQPKLIGEKYIEPKLIREIPKPIDIFLKVADSQSTTSTILEGSVTLPEYAASQDDKDVAVRVHTLEGPHENSNGKLFVEFIDLQDSEFKVLIIENLRPDYDLMTSLAVPVNSSSPMLSLSFINITADTWHFIGVLPGGSIKGPLHYKMKVFSVQCKMREVTAWVSPACEVGDSNTQDVVHCRCNHLSFFGSSIFVAPHSVHPINDLHLLLTVDDNPLVPSLVLSLLLIYLLLLMWTVLQHRKDRLKRQVIVLEDNFPGEEYPYLLVVYTAFNIGSGTGANIGIILNGSLRQSRAHVLRSSNRKAFSRNSDDWFLLFTRKSLGDLQTIHVWHDNTSSHPDWYCKKIKVFDLAKNKESSFEVELWFSVWPGEYTEAEIGVTGPDEIYNWQKVITNNILYNLQEKHLWISIFSSHPRATISKSQRLTMAFCIIMVTFLTGIMFYGVARGEVTEDEAYFEIRMREVTVAIQCAIMSSIITSSVFLCFKRSQQIVPSQTSVRSNSASFALTGGLSRQFGNKNGRSRLSMIFSALGIVVRGIVRGKPLIPILVGKESSESIVRRKRWARFGWVYSQLVIWSCGYFTILYGLKLGRVISELWLTSAIFCFGNGILISGPIKIILFSVVLSFFGEMYDVTTYECELQAASQNDKFGDEDHLSRVLALRKLPMYKPLSLQKCMEFQDKAIRRLNLIEKLEFVGTILFLLALFNLSGDQHHKMTFYINEHIFQRLTTPEKTDAVSLGSATNITRLTDYLISTLIPELYKEKWYNKNNLTSKDESLQEMGWMADGAHRLVGVPRLRQIRIQTEKCPYIMLFLDNETKKNCLPRLKDMREETDNFGLRWGPISKYTNKPLLAPWTYQRQLGDSSVIAGASGVSYHSSGYVSELDDTQKKCNLIISDLLDNNWCDFRTRAFFVEMTLYNANSDTYSLVTLISEQLSSGAFTHRVTVTTMHIFLHLVCNILFVCILLIFNFQLFVGINRHGLVSGVTRFWGVYDILLFGLADVAIFFEWFKIIRAATLVHIFQQIGNSGFFYFSNIVLYERLSRNLWCVILCLAPLRLFKFKLFVNMCWTACLTLYVAWKRISTILLVAVIMFMVQIFVLNAAICPLSFPFDIDMKCYKTWQNAEHKNSYLFCHTITSLLLLITCYFAVVILQMFLLYTYKITRAY